MGIGVSIFLIALGAILTFATDVGVSGLDLDVVGIVLMLVGALGLIMTHAGVGASPAADRARRGSRGAPGRAAPGGRRGAPGRAAPGGRRGAPGV